MLQGNAASEAELTSVGQLDVAMQFQQAAGRTEACRGLKHDKKGENYRY